MIQQHNAPLTGWQPIDLPCIAAYHSFIFRSPCRQSHFWWPPDVCWQAIDIRNENRRSNTRPLYSARDNTKRYWTDSCVYYRNTEYNKCWDQWSLWLHFVSSIFWHPRSDLPDGLETQRQKYTRRTRKIHSEISPIPSLNFTEVKKCKIWPGFLTLVAFDALWNGSGAINRKSKTSSWSNDDRSSLWLGYLAHSSPNFYRGSNISKFGLNLAFQAV